MCMYLCDGAVTAIVLTGGYYYCSYTFFFTYTSILIPRGGEGWGGVLFFLVARAVCACIYVMVLLLLLC